MKIIQVNKYLIALMLISVSFTSCKGRGNEPSIETVSQTYYVDNTNGNDNNNGLSENTAWKNLSKVSSITYNPGDKILFKSGGSWQGKLELKGSGTPELPILVDKYGEGNKPVISGGISANIISLTNVENWEIKNIAITGPHALYDYYAIRIYADNGFCRNIAVRDCEIYDFVGRSAISISGSNKKKTSGYNGLKIENNYIHDCKLADGRITNGIEMWTHGDEPLGPSLNVYVANNRIINVAGDGIVLQHCNKGLVEYNYVENVASAKFGHHAGIWCAFTNDAVIQYNEVCFTRKPDQNNDGCAFDADLGANRTIFQYNYSHDNEGGFILSMGHDKNVVVRYNISQNDKRRLFFCKFPSNDCLVYNNMFYGEATVYEYLDWNTNPPTPVFPDKHPYDLGGTWWNNIFWSTGAAYEIPSAGSNNISWGNAVGGIHTDPLLSAPGSGGKDINMKDGKRLAGYMLKAGSPCIDAGVIVQTNGNKDFWGNSLYKDAPNIGVHEGN